MANNRMYLVCNSCKIKDEEDNETTYRFCIGEQESCWYYPDESNQTVDEFIDKHSLCSSPYNWLDVEETPFSIEYEIPYEGDKDYKIIGGTKWKIK